MEKTAKKLNQFERDDGFNPTISCSNPIQEKWIHKEVVRKTGDGEDDFIIEHKAVCIDKIDIHKSIQEEAKTTDLKYLLQQVLRTGDESLLNSRPGFYGDVSKMPSDTIEAHNLMLNAGDLKKVLPPELAKLSVEEIAQMSNEDILKYFEVVRKVESSNVEEFIEEQVENKEKKEGLTDE